MKTFLLSLFLVSQVIASQTIFNDNFSVTGGGDVNFQYQTIGRQTGSEAPLNYYNANGPSTVTNYGANAGKCLMDGTPVGSWLSPGGNFNQSTDFSIEFELTRLIPADKNFFVSFGKNNVYKPANNADPGMGVIFFDNGWYQVFNSNILIHSQHFSELEAASNPTLEINITVSNSTYVTMFVNGTQYPINNSGPDVYIYEYTGGFENNYLTFNSINTDVTLDNFTVLDNKNYKFNNDRFQFVKTTPQINGSLSFTNINFPNGGDLMCYDKNPIIPGHNIYAPDFIRMSNFWRGYCGCET